MGYSLIKTMNSIIQKQILEWREEIKNHKQKLEQAQAVVEQEIKIISMVEGGIQFGEMLLKKNESSNQQSGTVELNQPQGKMSSKSKA